jgi:hypothetical protein
MDSIKLNVDSSLKWEHSQELRKISPSEKDVIARKCERYTIFRKMYLFSGNRNSFISSDSRIEEECFQRIHKTFHAELIRSQARFPAGSKVISPLKYPERLRGPSAFHSVGTGGSCSGNEWKRRGVKLTTNPNLYNLFYYTALILKIGIYFQDLLANIVPGP